MLNKGSWPILRFNDVCATIFRGSAYKLNEFVFFFEKLLARKLVRLFLCVSCTVHKHDCTYPKKKCKAVCLVHEGLV